MGWLQQIGASILILFAATFGGHSASVGTSQIGDWRAGSMQAWSRPDPCSEPMLMSIYNCAPAVYDAGTLATMELIDLHGLWGGYNVRVSADGDTSVESKEGPNDIQKFSAKLTPQQVAELTNVFSQNNFQSIPNINGSGLPDESIDQIVMVDSQGKSKVVSQPYNERTPAFKAIYDEFIKIAEQIRNAISTSTSPSTTAKGTATPTTYIAEVPRPLLKKYDELENQTSNTAPILVEKCEKIGYKVLYLLTEGGANGIMYSFGDSGSVLGGNYSFYKKERSCKIVNISAIVRPLPVQIPKPVMTEYDKLRTNQNPRLLSVSIDVCQKDSQVIFGVNWSGGYVGGTDYFTIQGGTLGSNSGDDVGHVSEGFNSSGFICDQLLSSQGE